MTRKWDRKMILSSILLVMIFIRHTVVDTYENNYKPSWNRINQNKQPFDQQYALTTHQALHSPHHHSRHHHDGNMHKNNREMHIKSKYNETNDGIMIQVKNRSANNNRSVILPNRVNVNNYEAPTTTFNAEHNARSHWSHNNRQSHQEHQHIKERSSQNNQRFFLEKTPRIDYVYTGKISHEDQGFKSKDDYDEYYYNRQSHQEKPQHKELSSKAQNDKRLFLEKTSKSRIDYVDSGKISHEDKGINTKDEYDEDYDENDYYDEDENDENENTVDVRQVDTQTERELLGYMLDESDSRKEEVKSEEESENMMYRDENGRQSVGNYDNSDEYLNDESNPFNDEQNQTLSLTEKKWKNYGTADAVLEQFLQNKVSENSQRLREEGKCRWPHPKVIQVIDPSDRFVPHCTILHRCADDTGCCVDDRKTCVAKSTTSVNLYFYISPLDNKSKASIGFRTFVNHTECHCVDRSIRYRRTPRLTYTPNTAISNEVCRCPSHFRVIRERTQCRCECLSWNQKCYDLKEGKDQFSDKDKKCILENKCQRPSCEYGHYNKHSGRCPKPSKPSTRKSNRHHRDLESNIFNGQS